MSESQIHIQLAGDNAEILRGSVVRSRIEIKKLEIDLSEVLAIERGDFVNVRRVILRNGTKLTCYETEMTGVIELRVPGIKQVQSVPLAAVMFLSHIT